ncbi:MAG: hypothetical protein DMENIID0003_03230 [Wolbachia endosymbiont of Sergentomyia squamirostris]|uniref:Type II toxin-antitoxin system RelE/ParE family toxin n=1 Tax=Wolbachia endosymbiont of Sergentomyia squamirostris TaxID=3113640 RepID=A0AAT9GBY2_9RICK
MMKTSGNKTYTIKFLKNVIEKEIPALPAKIKLMVQEAIKKRLTVDPFNLGKPLCHSFRGQYRIRVSNYRIIYIINHSERKYLLLQWGIEKTFTNTEDYTIKNIRKISPLQLVQALAHVIASGLSIFNIEPLEEMS